MPRKPVLTRNSDYGRFEIAVQASTITVVVRNSLTKKVIDSYRLTPEQSKRIRWALEDAEDQAIGHRRERQREEKTGLVQTSFEC
jgi:hypothetical protein